MSTVHAIKNSHLPETKSAEQVTWIVFTLACQLAKDKVKWREMKDTQSCLTLCNPMDYTVQNIGVGSHSLLQRIFPTQGLNPGLPHCRQILYQLSHEGSPWILEWVAYPFSRGIFPTKESNWSLQHCRQILYQLCYQGNPWQGNRVM